MKYLVTFHRDWADEFYVDGFTVYTQTQVDALKEWASTERSDWFGTNEGWEDTIFLDSLEFQEITDEEAEVIDRLFPRTDDNDSRLGHIPFWWTDE